MRPRRALKQWFSAVYIPQSHVEHLLGPPAPELAFLASCQVIQMWSGNIFIGETSDIISFSEGKGTQICHESSMFHSLCQMLCT